MEGLKFLGTNGSNIKDMLEYCPDFQSSPLAALEQTLQMRILYPTCPDTLRCYPVKQDPFLVYKSPNVYFAGNQAEFSTKRLENGTRLICVPKFRKTKQIVLMNLDTQHTFSYQFDCSYLMPAPTDHN
jgi:DNA polymerase II small subunit/DNA polymerase delta subunit B